MTRWIGLAGALLAWSACGGGGKKEVKAGGQTGGGVIAGGGDIPGVPPIDTTLCESTGKRVVTFDLNRDEKPDVWKLYRQVEQGGTQVEIESCRQIDYDHDGKKDHIQIFDETGGRIAEQFDFDYDGDFDAIYHYGKGGEVTMIERDSDHDGHSDVWEKYLPNGILESVRRDRNADGKPDLWENYQNGQLYSILYDDDYDTKVDRKEEGPQPAVTAEPDAEAPGTTPTPPAPSPTGG